MKLAHERAAFLESDEGAAAKKELFAFRLWCVVELHAALHFGKPVVIRAGKATREGAAVKFDTAGAGDMLINLASMIDVERAECAVRADYDREMDAVQNGEGVENVNKRVAGAVIGGMASAGTQVLAVDAAVCGEPEALRALPRDRVEKALRAAAAGGRRAALEELVARRVVNLAREDYPLWIAATGGHHEVVTMLIAAGASVDPADNIGTTPLLGAAQGGHLEVVTTLIAAGATVDLANNSGSTPLSIAAQNGHHEVATALIAARATVDQANNSGSTPLLMAAYKGHVEVVRLLVRAGADTTLGDAAGPPIDQICKARSADKANEGEIKAILLSARPRACCVIM